MNTLLPYPLMALAARCGLANAANVNVAAEYKGNQQARTVMTKYGLVLPGGVAGK